MKKKNLLSGLIGILVVLGLMLFLLSCENEQEIVYVDEQVYVQDDSGKWIEYALFMSMMQAQHRTIDVHHYHYSTKSSNGQFKEYKPTKQQFTQMKDKKFKGTFKNTQTKKKNSGGNFKFSSSKKNNNFKTSSKPKNNSSFSNTTKKKTNSFGSSSTTKKKSSSFGSSSKKSSSFKSSTRKK